MGTFLTRLSQILADFGEITSWTFKIPKESACFIFKTSVWRPTL